MKDSYLPLHSRSFFSKNWGGPRAPELRTGMKWTLPWLSVDFGSLTKARLGGGRWTYLCMVVTKTEILNLVRPYETSVH